MKATGDLKQTVVWIVFTHTLLPNGPAHRLVTWLRSSGYEAVLAGLPMPGADHFRLEFDLPGKPRRKVLKNIDKNVPSTQHLLNCIQALAWATHLRRFNGVRICLVGCDPLAYLLARYSLKIAGVLVHSQVLYFVDWSAQRLDEHLTAQLYRSISRLAMLRADHVRAISTPASAALTTLASGGKVVHDIPVMPNIPLRPARNPDSWVSRKQRLVYFGGIRSEHGAHLIPRIATALDEYGLSGYHFDIAGDGPEVQSLKNQLRLLKNVTFHGTIEDSEALSQLAQSARVGLALYDPSYAMFAFNDPLKIKDYLSAGLRVVSTLPTSVDDGVILKTSYSVDSIVPAIVTALTEAPAFPPNTHKILHDGEKALTTLVEQITTEEN